MLINKDIREWSRRATSDHKNANVDEGGFHHCIFDYLQQTLRMAIFCRDTVISLLTGTRVLPAQAMYLHPVLGISIGLAKGMEGGILLAPPIQKMMYIHEF